MNTLNIILLAAGAIVFIVSFIMPEMGSELEQIDPQITRKQIRDMIDKEMKDVKSQVTDIVEETSNYSVEKTERALERLTNEKITAVSEYSDTVMNDIHKSHEEVLFLYDMLNNKHEDLKETVSEVSASVKEAKVTGEALQNVSREVKKEIVQEEAAVAPEPEDLAGDSDTVTESFHSDTAREFFEKHEQSQAPTIDEIRASFQPMAFGKLQSVDGDSERVFGQTGQEVADTDTSELEGLDDEAMDAAIDELLGVGGAENGELNAVAEESTPAPAPAQMNLDSEAAMDAALAAISGQVADQNAASAAKEAETAFENEASATGMGSETALENVSASAKENVIALENDEAQVDSMENSAMKDLEKSISAMIAEDKSDKTLRVVEEDQARELIREKPVKKSRSSKSKKPENIALNFRMDGGSVNNNERIMELHKKGKSNIAIAKELGLGVGEVKLVLDLFKGA